MIDTGADHMVALSNEVLDTEHDGNRYTLLAGLYGPSGRQIQRYANVMYTAVARSQAEAICCTISTLRSQQLAKLRQPVRLAWDTDTASIWISEMKSRVPNVVGETRTTNVTYYDGSPMQHRKNHSSLWFHRHRMWQHPEAAS